MFKELEKYIDDPKQRWKHVLRIKRGLTDTSQKGGLYKDKVYLEGALDILSQRNYLNFKALMCGKISLKDLPREDVYCQLNYENLILPKFMENMEEYMQCLEIIAKTNHIEECSPADAIKLPQASEVNILREHDLSDDEDLDPKQADNQDGDDENSFQGNESIDQELDDNPPNNNTEGRDMFTDEHTTEH